MPDAEKRVLVYEKHAADIGRLMDMGFTKDQAVWAFFQTSSVDEAVGLIADATARADVPDFRAIPQ